MLLKAFKLFGSVVALQVILNAAVMLISPARWPMLPHWIRIGVRLPSMRDDALWALQLRVIGAATLALTALTLWGLFRSS